MIKWLLSLWASSFVKVVHLDKYNVYVSYNMGGYTLFTILVLVLIGIALGVLSTLFVIKWFTKVK